MKTPVAILFYKRPHLVAGLLKLLQAQQPEKIWLISDGPKPGSSAEQAACREARNVAEKSIDWHCEVRRVYAKDNLGLNQRIQSGLDELFSVEQEAVILEEDCHPKQEFLPFCDAMLNRYRNEPRIAGISGTCFLPTSIKTKQQYFFSRYLHIWGWATWGRAWNSYDRDAWSWPPGGFRSIFPRASKAEEKYWNRTFQRETNGNLLAWDYRWASWCWMQNWVAVNPTQNLIQNVGFGPEATHTHDPSVGTGIEREAAFPPPYLGPRVLEPDIALDRAIFQNGFLRMEGRRNLLEKIRDRILRLFK